MMVLSEVQSEHVLFAIGQAVTLGFPGGLRLRLMTTVEGGSELAVHKPISSGGSVRCSSAELFVLHVPSLNQARRRTMHN